MTEATLWRKGAAASGDGASSESPAEAEVSIADRSYRNYDGPLRSRSTRWWIVALSTIRGNVNKARLAFWLPVGIIALTYLIRTIYFYVHQTIVDNLAQRMVIPPEYPNAYAASLYNSMSLGFTSLIIFIAAIVVGAASIAADNRANALLVYLSKPITRVDYLFGKWAGVFLLLYAVCLAPSLLMLCFFIGAYYNDGFLRDNAALIPKVFVASAIPPLLHASLIVGFSAWSKSARVTGAAYAAFYLILNSLAIVLGIASYSGDPHHAHQPQTAMVMATSVFGTECGLMQHVYDVTPPPPGAQFGGRRKRRRRQEQTNPPGQPARLDAPPRPAFVKPPLWYVGTLGGLFVVLPLAAAAVKVRAVEVIRG